MPTGGALFGSSAGGTGSTGGIKHLIEVRAGKMTQKGRMVYPDKRKGLLYLYQSEDSLIHFCWQDRTTGVVEDDLIIFPDDCEYVKVSQCTTGRAYLLKFKTSNRRFFFWLQEPLIDKDIANCKRINEILNNPASSISNSGPADQDLQSLLNNMSQSQLMQLFGSGVGQISGLSSLLGTINRSSSGSGRTATAHRNTTATPTATTTTTTTTSATSSPAVAETPPVAAAQAETTPPVGNPNPIQLADLQNFLQGITPVTLTEQSGVDLSTALTGETLSNLLTSNESMQQLESHLPAIGGSTEEQLRSTLTSPQFQQAVQQFSSALESGQLAPIVDQLSVNADAVAAAGQGNMAEFVKALEKSSELSTPDTSEKDKKENTQEPKKPEDGDDMHMQLD